MKRHCNNNKCTIALTFAIGLLISCFCPPKFLVGVLCVWIIILAITKNRC